MIGVDGQTPELSADRNAPGFEDDAVDELVEHVLLHGGWVAFVAD